MGGGLRVCDMFLNLEYLGVNPHKSQDHKEGAQRKIGRARSEAWLNHKNLRTQLVSELLLLGSCILPNRILGYRNTNRDRQVPHLQVSNPEAFAFAGQVTRAQRHAGSLLLGNWAPKRGP